MMAHLVRCLAIPPYGMRVAERRLRDDLQSTYPLSVHIVPS
jgi:hypothetical protein